MGLKPSLLLSLLCCRGPVPFPELLPPLLALCHTALSELEQLHSSSQLTSCLRIHDLHHHLLEPVLQLAACSLPMHAHDSQAAACTGLYVSLLVQHLNGICRCVCLFFSNLSFGNN